MVLVAPQPCRAGWRLGNSAGILSYRQRFDIAACFNMLSGMIQPTPLLGTADLAIALGIGERAVRSMALRGYIPSYKVGNRRRFKLADVEDALRDPRYQDRSKS